MLLTDIDANFVHDFFRQRMNFSGLQPGTISFVLIPGIGPQESFRHLAPGEV